MNLESGKLIGKPENDLDDHLKRDHPDSFREKHLQIQTLEPIKELEQRSEKKRFIFKKQKLKTANNKNGVKNKRKNDFSNYKIDNITGVEVVDNQSERKPLVEGKIQRKKSYAEILKTDRNTAGKLEQTRTKYSGIVV